LRRDEFHDGLDEIDVKCRAANLRLPKLPANKTAAAIADRRQTLRVKQAQVLFTSTLFLSAEILLFGAAHFSRVLDCQPLQLCLVVCV